MSRCIHLSLLVLLLTAGCKSFSQPLTWPFSRDTPSASQDRTSATEASGQVSRVEQANRLLLAEGQGLEREGKLQDAANTYQKILRHSPGHADASHRLAVVYSKQGRLSEADELFQTALAVRPDSAGVHCDLGYSQYLRGQWDVAESHFRRALELDPTFQRAHTNLGMLLARQQRHDEAYREFQRAGCGSGEAKSNLALAAALESRWQEADSLYQQARQESPRLDKADQGQRLVRKMISRPTSPPDAVLRPLPPTETTAQMPLDPNTIPAGYWQNQPVFAGPRRL
ncbi:MAG TPA: tetratricopeptide repeat protein [Candidatus Anammoximicrobium sp.]|nr:tetratricopeptide repeat protein [Candidatus Anammoximicrobium sp.]